MQKFLSAPYNLWSSCRTEFPSLGAQKDVEGKTGSPGHLAAWEDEGPETQNIHHENIDMTPVY